MTIHATVTIDGATWAGTLLPLESVTVTRGGVELPGVTWDRQRLRGREQDGAGLRALTVALREAIREDEERLRRMA